MQHLTFIPSRRIGAILVLVALLLAVLGTGVVAFSSSAEAGERPLAVDVEERVSTGHVTVTGTGPRWAAVRITGGVLPVTAIIDGRGELTARVMLQPNTEHQLVVRLLNRPEAEPVRSTVEQRHQPGEVTIIGSVLSATDGTPLEGAVIRYGTSVTYSDADGAYSLRDVPPGAVMFTVELGGHLADVGLAHVGERNVGLNAARANPVRLTSFAEGVHIGPTGGVIEGDGWRVEIPAGAVAERTLIQATPMTFTGQKDTVGLPLIDLSPTGLELAVPAVVSFDPARYGLPAGAIRIGGFDPDTHELYEHETTVVDEWAQVEVDTFHGMEMRSLHEAGLEVWGGAESWCTPFGQVQAGAAYSYLNLALIPFLKVTISDTAAAAYDRYLTVGEHTTAEHHVTTAYDDFRFAPETLESFEFLLEEVAADHEPVELRGPDRPTVVGMRALDEAHGQRDINYSDPFTTPGNMAGGTGHVVLKGITFPDEREFTGPVRFEPEANSSGLITGVRMVTDLDMRIRDGIDFCPDGAGGKGASMEMHATLPLSRLEVTPYGWSDTSFWATRYMWNTEVSFGEIEIDVTDRYGNDMDGDGIPEIAPWQGWRAAPLDNCPATVNPTQIDRDDDGIGDACDDTDDRPHEIDDRNPGGHIAERVPAPAVDCTSTHIVPNDDGSGEQVMLPFPIDFHGQRFESAYVNNNGNVTFTGAMGTFTPFDVGSSGTAMVAPFFADVDTRNDSIGQVTYGTAEVAGRLAFCARWDQVGYFNEQYDKRNTFQLLLVDRSDIAEGAFDIVFDYGSIQWETGSASGGENGFGGTPAAAGWSNGAGSGASIGGSLQSGAFLDSSPFGLAVTSRGTITDGIHIWEIRNDG